MTNEIAKKVRLSLSDFTNGKPSVCQKGLGLENFAIPDSSITASSTFWPDTTFHIPGNGRLRFQGDFLRDGGWRADNNRDNSWFQVDFGRFVKVTTISTQGSNDDHQWVTRYRVTYSYDGKFLRDYNEGGHVKVPTLSKFTAMLVR